MYSKLNKFMSMTAMALMMAGGNDMYSPDITYSTNSCVNKSYKRKKCKSCSKFRSNTGCSYPLNQACYRYTKRK